MGFVPWNLAPIHCPRIPALFPVSSPSSSAYVLVYDHNMASTPSQRINGSDPAASSTPPAVAEQLDSNST